MSKLYNTYVELKRQNAKCIYLFRSGIFFIAIEDDAKTLSKLFNFKISNLSPSIIKCGFPCSSYEKYSKLFNLYSLDIQLIDLNKNITYTLKDYNQNLCITELINTIKSININSLSVKEAYELLEKLQKIIMESI